MLLVVALVAFVGMEGFTYLAHRFVMHGIAWGLHRSHHESAAGRFEANDVFPCIGAAVAMVGFAVGFNVPVPTLVAVGAGVTAYGFAYMFVHDVYIHGRLGRLPEVALLERLRRAHAIHHLFKGEPYGMLLPVLPRRWRSLARTVDADAAVARPGRLPVA
jgi:beta-carotene 3-hydroxylase